MNAPIIEKPDPTTLMIRRTFDADIETLWKALTDPAAWMQWMGGGHATPVKATADLTVGGAWHLQMQGNETGNKFEVSGTFLEIDPPRRLVFTWIWAWEPDRTTQVTYVLSPAESPERTTLLLTHERLADSDVRDSHARGWSANFETLAAYLQR